MQGRPAVDVPGVEEVEEVAGQAGWDDIQGVGLGTIGGPVGWGGGGRMGPTGELLGEGGH